MNTLAVAGIEAFSITICHAGKSFVLDHYMVHSADFGGFCCNLSFEDDFNPTRFIYDFSH